MSGPLVAVIGVAGSGKSTVGEALAARLGVPFADADGFHPTANVTKMAAGRPLDDADRLPWLEAVGGWLAEHAATGAVTACSALRVAYRHTLRTTAPDLVCAHLDLPRDVVAERVARRTGHFMPATLVDSQLATLEPLTATERGLTLDATLPVDTLLEALLANL